MAVATAMPVVARELDAVRSYSLAFSLFLTASLLGMVVAGGLADSRGPTWPLDGRDDAVRRRARRLRHGDDVPGPAGRPCGLGARRGRARRGAVRRGGRGLPRGRAAAGLRLDQRRLGGAGRGRTADRGLPGHRGVLAAGVPGRAPGRRPRARAAAAAGAAVPAAPARRATSARSLSARDAGRCSGSRSRWAPPSCSGRCSTGARRDRCRWSSPGWPGSPWWRSGCPG